MLKGFNVEEEFNQVCEFMTLEPWDTQGTERSYLLCRVLGI